MKRHYAFVPLKDSDFKTFRKTLIGNLWFRPLFCLALAGILIFMGFLRYEALLSDSISFIFYSFVFAFIIYLGFHESQKIKMILSMKKNAMLSFIHPVKGDSFFYKEEVHNGFIIQIEPVNFLDIKQCKENITSFLDPFKERYALAAYLKSCINSTDEFLQNKAVVYMEVINDQIAKGNLSILDTHETLVNFKEDLS